MRTLVKMAPLVLLLFSVAVVVSAENIVSTAPYDIPGGLVNDIRRYFDPDQPPIEIKIEEFPEYYFNFTAEIDGWLEIGISNQNGTRPVIHVNGGSVYAQMDPFYREKVFTGDFIEVHMVPPRVLEDSFSSVQDDQIITTWKLFTWDDMSGVLLFTLIPRVEIAPDFTYSPETPVEGGTVKFYALGVTEDIDIIFWDLYGPGLFDDGRGGRYLSPRLEVGGYNVTLTFVDVFGYSVNMSKAFVIQSEVDEVVPEPGVTQIDVSDVVSPSSSLINEVFEVEFSLDYQISGPREIRLRVIDVESGTVLYSVDDRLDVNGSKPYLFSLVASPVPRPMILRVDVYHDELGVWVKSGSSPAFTVDLSAPEQVNGFPLFPVVGVLMGLVGLVLLKRRF